MKMPQGKYQIWISEKCKRATNQTEALAIVFEFCATIKPDLVDYLAGIRKPKVRLIAKDWRELNLDRPDLSAKKTQVFGNYWIYNTRSGPKVVRLMNLACWYVGIKFMKDVKVELSMFDDPNYQPQTYFDAESLL